ncbi:MAG: MFS transporter [Paracoccaceae bacterium]|nr:MAG: MFS transporter [Paracoccaceae bacterium]
MEHQQPDPPYRWVIVAAGGVLGCAAMGALFSLPVLLNSITAETGWSRTGVSAAMTIAFLAMAATSLPWGMASDRFGTRPVVLTGAVIFSLGLFLASRAPALWMFQALFGLLLGGSIMAFMAPLMANVTGWFTTRRGLAVSLVSSGMGLAPATMSPLAAWLVVSFDWRTVVALLAAIVAAITIPAALLLRQPPDRPAVTTPDAPPADMTLRQAMASVPFLVLFATFFFCCATHSGPIFHTVSYAEFCGIATIAAVTIYSVEGLAGLGGRIGFGMLGDRFGAKRILVIGLLAQGFGAMGYFFARDLWEFYVVAAIFGFIYAGIMPLYNVLIRENFSSAIMGGVMGGVGVAGTLGMATGPVVGGWIFDVTGSYGGLYITSFAFGLSACLIALTYRPFPRAAEPAPRMA